MTQAPTAGRTAPAPQADSHDLIRVLGARVNNLKDVSVEIPKRRLTAFTGVSDWQVRNQIIARVAAGEALAGVPSFAAAVIERHAPIAAVINEFYRQLHLVDRRTPYPAAAARAAWPGIVRGSDDR